MKIYTAKLHDVRGCELITGQAKSKTAFTAWAKSIQKERGWGHADIYEGDLNQRLVQGDIGELK